MASASFVDVVTVVVVVVALAAVDCKIVGVDAFVVAFVGIGPGLLASPTLTPLSPYRASWTVGAVLLSRVRLFCCVVLAWYGSWSPNCVVNWIVCCIVVSVGVFVRCLCKKSVWLMVSLVGCRCFWMTRPRECHRHASRIRRGL
jgi:hypothetical protein